ncbi:hypothetical protein KTC96_11200 [Clostridium estertheticum]|uniref:hypothetical protein n=1 Tax=Clostridium estertheticum TaxID=238834 RepID=UPI001C7CF1AB|nr:hypothetical protein [Clostridium estertheticum]MBX4261691.1 hypothetical protein [Clostridium estertheticum]WLC68597.1 hypothetical protein KTC96_11200 [Clostridium estertheticum]
MRIISVRKEPNYKEVATKYIHSKWENFEGIYLCTELNEFYEKYGFSYLEQGFYPDGQPSKIYEDKLIK